MKLRTPPPRTTVDVWICLDDSEDYAAGDIRRGKLPPELRGWARCDGAQMTRTKFPKLYEAIGLAFSPRVRSELGHESQAGMEAEDDGETFLLPDLRGRPWPGDPLPPLEAA